jgi:predicted DNA-binding transcriptional regulator YafY
MRAGTEESRERKIALFMTLVHAFENQSPMTQEEIVAHLRIDEFPVTTVVPKRKLAYDGNENAFRQKFERDKAAIRDLGFELTTTKNSYGVDAYCIDPSSVYVPSIAFEDEELDLLAWATRLLGVGTSGVGQLFADGPVPSGGVEFSPILQPLTRALALRRTVRFNYRRNNDKIKERELAPLEIMLWRGQPYVIGIETKSDIVKGFKVTRITSVPVLTSEIYTASDELKADARTWTPNATLVGEELVVHFVTSSAFAQLIRSDFTVDTKSAADGEAVQVTLRCSSLESARRVLLSFSDHIHSVRPKPVSDALAQWLKRVNQPTESLKGPFDFSSSGSRPDILGQTLQLMATVYQAREPLRASQLAERSHLDSELVQSIMSRLMALQYLRDPTTYLIHIELGDDNDDDELTDPSYARSASYDTEVAAKLAALTWRDAFELIVALREAQTLYPSEVLSRVIAKLENTIQTHVRVMEVEPGYLSTVRDAIDKQEQLKIDYWSPARDEVSQRWVEPRAMASRNGRWYFRAWCATRESWLTFRVDRVLHIHASGPAPSSRDIDRADDWVQLSPDEGYEVTLAIAPDQRWLFEPLANVQWATSRSDHDIVRLRVRDDRFLDQLLVEAGAGCWVLEGPNRDAGRELARRIIAQL